MSSVNSDSGASSAAKRDELNHLREEYRKKEQALLKKHNSQVRQITQNHLNELDKIKKQHGEQMTRFRRQSNEVVTRRDQKHSKEIENVRKTYLSRFEDLRQDTNKKLKDQREHAAKEKATLKKNHESRFANLSDTYTTSLKDQKATFDEKLGDFRTQQRKSINSQRDQLLNKQEKFVKGMRENHEGQIEDLRTAFDRYRYNQKDRMLKQELRHGRDTRRMSEANVASINRERAARADSEAELREGFKAGLERTRQEFVKAEDKRQKAAQQVGQSFEKDVSARIERDIRRLKSKIADLKETNVRNRASIERTADRSVQNVRDAYQKKYESLLEQREIQKQAYNDRNSKDIDRVHKEKNKVMTQQARFYRSRLTTDQVKAKEAVKNLEDNFAERVSAEKNKADTRITKIRDSHNQEEERMRGVYDKNLEAVREANFREREDLRASLISEKESALREMRAYVNKNEAQHAEQISTTINKFKKQIAELNDKMLREKRLRDSREKSLISNIKRAHDNELEAQKLNYEAKMAETNNTHRDEKQAMDRRHQAQLDKLLNTVRNQKA